MIFSREASILNSTTNGGEGCSKTDENAPTEEVASVLEKLRAQNCDEISPENRSSSLEKSPLVLTPSCSLISSQTSSGYGSQEVEGTDCTDGSQATADDCHVIPAAANESTGDDCHVIPAAANESTDDGHVIPAAAANESTGGRLSHEEEEMREDTPDTEIGNGLQAINSSKRVRRFGLCFGMCL